MAYRIVQIQKPYEDSVHITVSCSIVESTSYDLLEDAKDEIRARANSKKLHASAAPADWFIIIQTFE